VLNSTRLATYCYANGISNDLYAKRLQRSERRRLCASNYATLSYLCDESTDAVHCRSNYHLKCLLKEAVEDGELFNNWNKHDKDFFIHLIQTASLRA
jgi:hypothetical protein